MGEIPLSLLIAAIVLTLLVLALILAKQFFKDQ